MDDIPDEILQYICSQLPPVELFDKRLMCRRWRNVISLLWANKLQELNIPDDLPPHSSTKFPSLKFQDFVERLHNCKRVNVKSDSNLLKPIIFTILTSVLREKIQAVHIDLVSKGTMSIYQLQQLSSLTQLKELDLTLHANELNSIPLTQVIFYFDSLESFSLSHGRILISKPRNYDPESLRLRKFVLNSCIFANSARPLCFLFQRFLHLEHFEITNCYDNQGYIDLNSLPADLNSLHLRSVWPWKNHRDSKLADIAKRYTSISHLSLVNVPLTTKQLTSIVLKFPKLRSLDLTNSVSEATVKRCLPYLTELFWLNLSFIMLNDASIIAEIIRKNPNLHTLALVGVSGKEMNCSFLEFLPHSRLQNLYISYTNWLHTSKFLREAVSTLRS